MFLEGVTGFQQMNMFQGEELVSHGYIVVAIDQPGVGGNEDAAKSCSAYFHP